MGIDLSRYGYLRHISVLICDDVPTMRSIVRRMLEAFGIKKIYEADDARQAFKISRENDLNLIITDWQMPGISGIDLLRAIRWHDDGDKHGATVPIIMLTSLSETARVKKARDNGVSAYLSKPVSAQMLLERIVMILDDDRQTVRSERFIGPCRRLREASAFGGPDRRCPH